MPEQRKSLTEPQRRALRNARDFLTLDRELHPDADPWHAACRMAITDILAAFEADLAENDGEGEDVRPLHQWRPVRDAHDCGPGQCPCGADVDAVGHVTMTHAVREMFTDAGQVIPAGAS